MKLGNKVRFKKEYLNGYPIVSLSEKHFDIQPEYKFSSVSYIRPIAQERKATAKIVLGDEYGDVFEEDILLEFKFSESERLIEALKPSSFKVRESALMLDHPQKITPVDFVNKFSDVIVMSVDPKRTSKKELWNIVLIVRFVNSDSVYDVIFPINYNDLASVSETGMIPLHKTPIEEIESDSIPSFDSIDEFSLEENFVKGSPPVSVNPKVVIPQKNVKIFGLEYIPPANIDSKDAMFKIIYQIKDRKKKISKLVSFKFSKTVREAADISMKGVYSTDFQYTNQERLTIPLAMEKDDFKYIGDLQNLNIIDIEYNYSMIENDNRFIPMNLIVEFKTIHYRIKKVIEFAYSKDEYSNGSFQESYQESDAIMIPEAYSNAMFLDKVDKKVASAKKALILNCKISKNYDYSKILDIKITRFIPDSNLVIFFVKVEEEKEKEKLVHNFEKVHILDETLNEMLLEKVKIDDILVKNDTLPITPSFDSINEEIFIVPSFTKIDSLQFSKPKLDSRYMNVQLKLRSGKKSRFLEKKVYFQSSIKESIKKEFDLHERKYLENLNPKDIIIRLDTKGEPVDSISKDDIFGIPNGIEIDIDYRKPKIGFRNARLFLKLRKNNFQVTFEQTIMFEKKLS